MKNQKKGIGIYDIVAIGLMAAFVFVATFFFKIEIPSPAGTTMVKLGNGVCVLGALLLGGWRGGLAAAIGCALYDLTDPVFAPEAYITFIRYFIMAFLCGTIAHWGGAQGRKFGRNVVAAIVGAYSYSAMYIFTKVGTLVVAGSALKPALVACSVNIASSLFNATVGVVFALLLAPTLRKALTHTTFGEHVYGNT